MHWANKLWGNIIPHSHLHTLHNRIATGHQITIASDASMNAANNSCFAWIIMTTQNEWTGTSPIPGPAEDNHTGWAEAYDGVLTALQFLCHYPNHYPTNYSQAKPIKVYCDNQGILQCTQQLLPPNTQYSRDSIQDDYYLYAMIAQVVQEFNPTQWNSTMSKGIKTANEKHQNTQTPNRNYH